MKFVTINENYISPNPTKGIFPNAYIEDFKKIIEKDEVTVFFGLYFKKEDQPIRVDETALFFDSNAQTAFIGLSPTKDSTKENPVFKEIKPLMEFVKEGGDISKGVITDYGYPSYDQVKSFFEGGSFDNPELHLCETPLKEFAKRFFLNKVCFEGEPMSKQFKFDATSKE